MFNFKIAGVKVRNFEIEYIKTDTALTDCVTHLETQEEIAFDLEFDKNLFRYGFNLCLIQICSQTRCFVVDPMALTNAQLKPLFAVFENPKILKVIHSGSEDLRLLQTLGCHLRGLFDTETALKLLNYERTSLGSLILAKFEIEISKSLQTSNWGVRPLSEKQIIYSAHDVVFLLELRTILTQELADAQKIDWFWQEVQHFESLVFVVLPVTDFLTAADRKEFSEYHQFVLNGLLTFREKNAEKAAKPAYQVIANDLVRKIVGDPTILDNWLKERGIYHAFKTSVFQEKMQDVYAELCAEADNQQLSKTDSGRVKLTDAQHRENTRRRHETETFKEQIFKPIQAQIAARFNEPTARQVLTNTLVSDIASGKTRISEIPLRYKREILVQSADELGIDLARFE